MRHLITGGSGFVGSYMCDALVARGERPMVIDLVPPPARHADKVDFVQGDILFADLEAPLAEDVVVHHLAARQFNGPVPKKRADRTAWFDAVNVAGTERLLDAMVAKGARKLVFFSTDMTYGVPDESPVPVTHPQRPIGPYGGSKVKAERAIGRRAEAGAIDASVFRPRLIAGAGRLGILAKLFRLIDKGLPVPLIGSGRNRYQMIAVTDCVSAALRAAELGCPGGFFNLGSEDPPEVRALLGEVVARAGSKSRLVPTPAAMVQSVLDLLDRAGATLLYPEQFAIADVDYLLDTSLTRATFDWRPARRDSDILFEAFADFKATN